MKIPYNSTSLKSKMKSVFSKGAPAKTGDGEKPKDDDLSRRTMSRIAQEKAKRKQLSDELANANTTAARRQEIIDGLTAQLEAAQTELEEHKTKVEELKPQAKAWCDYEHKERQKLIQSFPPEEQKDAKAIGEGMSIENFRKYTQKITGVKAEQSQQAGKDGKGGKDWEAILKGDPIEADKVIAADQAGFNAFMDSQK